MFNRNANYNDWLVPYLEGGLDPARTAEIGARLAADPALAQEAERLKEMLGHLRESAARQPDLDTARVPADLWPRLHARLSPAPAPRRTATLRWAAAVSVAALAGAALWLPGLHPMGRTRGPVAPPVKVVTAPPREPALRPAPTVSAGTSNTLTLPKAITPAPIVVLPTAPKVARRLPAPARSPETSLSLPVPSARAATRMAGRAAAPSASFAFPLSGALPPAVAAKMALKNSTTNKPTLMVSNTAHLQDGDRVANGDASFARSQLKAAQVPLNELDNSGPAPASVTEPAATQTNAAGVTGVLRDPQRPDALPAPAAPLAPSPATDTPNASVAAVPPGAMAGGAAGGNRRGGAGGGGGFGGGSFGVGGGFGGRAFVRAFDAGSTPSLDAWQTTLTQALSPPLLGDDLGTQQASGALTAAREAGQLEALRTRLEAKRAQDPADLVTARTLAALYDFTAQHDLALQERRRLTALTGAVGEDWFALAQAEDQAGNKPAASAAYRRAVTAPAPLSAPHAALARQRE